MGFRDDEGRKKGGLSYALTVQRTVGGIMPCKLLVLVCLYLHSAVGNANLAPRTCFGQWDSHLIRGDDVRRIRKGGGSARSAEGSTKSSGSAVIIQHTTLLYSYPLAALLPF